jgi:hypothetical protein
MHAIWAFLIDEMKVDPGDTPEQAREYLTDAVESSLETYFSAHGDMNNYYQPCLAISREGEVLVFPSKLPGAAPEDPEELEWPQRYRALPVDARFPAALREAVEVAAYHFEIDGLPTWAHDNRPEAAAAEERLKGMETPAILTAILNDVSARLVEEYQKIVGTGQIAVLEDKQTTVELDESARRMTWHLRYRLVTAFELFCSANIQPFASYLSIPEDYRCYDLRTMSEDERQFGDDTGIVFVDVHT